MNRWSLLIFLFLYLRTIQTQRTTIYNNRGVSDNSIEYGSSIQPPRQSFMGRSQKIMTDANKKPMFTECEKYKPYVQEEQEKAFVIKVKAYDDDPPNAGGTVKYNIVKRDGERTYFTINNSTGEIRTFIPFDRDDPLRQKELYLTVQATDNGRPPLSDICTFKVTVTDINDNTPSFDSQDYNTQVAEDLKIGSEVMRVFAYDIDDGENSRLTYSFGSGSDTGDFLDYFKIDSATGVVYLKQSLMTQKDRKFKNIVIVSDNGKTPLKTEAGVSILVVSSDKQSPKIIGRYPEDDIILDENFQDYSKHLVTIEAESGIEDTGIVFELIKGKTTQTNKDQTFILTPSDKNDNTAYISLVRNLDYETVTEYTLTVRVKNKHLMDTSINIPIKIRDVNDETPNFIELIKGSVVENDDPGAQAMVVRAIDKDGTSANNIVSYELLSYEDLFSIDKATGTIKSKVGFDREDINLYHVKVKAYDNSPSALIPNSLEPNSVIQTFQISIEDRNDNPPKFTQPVYYIIDVSESSDKAKDVGEVKAQDNDTASLITYSIIDGNIDDAFYMENTTGRIKVNGKLDFEKIEKYTLMVRAYDGIFDDNATVIISILNENDEPPVFEAHEKNINLMEEEKYEECINVTIKAYDPDIKNRTADQHILYDVDKQQKDFLSVSPDGCVKLLKPLDRDKPFGSPTRQVFIYAYDNDGSSNSLKSYTEFTIILEDKNDNAPFLNVTEIVWNENQDPGLIGKLSADDYDSPKNGPPFIFELADTASDDIRNKFKITDESLYAMVRFDREEKKYYDIPISITDSGDPPLNGISILRVIIGDENDNEAKDGTSEIFVYKYQGLQQNIAIGRVYVDDLDDWDLPDKVFVQQNLFEYFYLSDTDNGMIIMRQNALDGPYVLHYEVTEDNSPLILKHTVQATVLVNVTEIPEEAVRKSGSIRIQGSTIEQFVEKRENGASRKDLLQQYISKIVNTSLENVDVFTVIPSTSNSSLIDVRFSAHGSPYYASEKLNNKVTEYQDKLQTELGVEFVMISISECLNETACPIGNSCSNLLDIKDEPAVVFTNKTSFVGVKAVVEPVCDCLSRNVNECFNDGSSIDNGVCSCQAEFEGPHCEILSIGFNGDGWAMYPTFDACNSTDITLTILPQSENGLIFYAGPLTLEHAQLSKDFISLELKDGYPLLKLDYGEGTEEILNNNNLKKLTDGAAHKLRITYSIDDVQIEIDDCKTKCTLWKSLNNKGLLNVNGPLQLGGMSKIFNDEEAKATWNHLPPTHVGFSGCIRNFTYNGFMYNLGAPSDHYRAFPNCNYGVIAAVTFGIDSNFLVAILVCLAILIILLLAVVVHRRKQDNLNEKDIDDTRENIINYEDEGGGECDTNYDLSVFHTNLDEKPIMKDSADVPADISGFLDNKKGACDKDPDNLPYDDVRHYAYEGDGNSTGSLSSLASCTDEGDLNFDYLSSFGPRFRKLADMYGENPSDEDSQNGGEESWC